MTIKERVLQLVAEETGRPLEFLSEDSRFDTLEMDSLDFLDLLCSVDAAFDISIPEGIAPQLVTIGGLIRAVEICKCP